LVGTAGRGINVGGGAFSGRAQPARITARIKKAPAQTGRRVFLFIEKVVNGRRLFCS
jgi:hypothetical protein